MQSIEQAPAWAKKPLQEALNNHPGRPTDAEYIGISTYSYSRKLANDVVHGRATPPVENARVIKGTMLHENLFGNAPNREVEVRLNIPDTELFLHGHFDAYDPHDGGLRDLKTSDRYSVTDGMRGRYERQTLLYAAAVRFGEVNTGTKEDPEWVPASDVLGDDAPTAATVDWWGAKDEIDWKLMTWDEKPLMDGAMNAMQQANQDLRAMVADSWTPPREEPDEEPVPVAVDDVGNRIEMAGRARERKEEASDEYDKHRGALNEELEETVRYGPWMAKKVRASTKEVLDVEKARAHVSLEEHQSTRPVARVTDADAFAEWAHTLGEVPGVELDTRTELDEEGVRAALEEAGVLTECLEEEVTRKGYVSVTRDEDEGGAS